MPSARTAGATMADEQVVTVEIPLELVLLWEQAFDAITTIEGWGEKREGSLDNLADSMSEEDVETLLFVANAERGLIAHIKDELDRQRWW